MPNRLFWGVAALLLLFSAPVRAESQAAGKGGPFLMVHATPVSEFDGDLKGAPLVLGGSGVGLASRNFRLGGAGGAGFLWNPSQNIEFGMGYGGILGEYSITNWLNIRLIIGGGGYAISKIVEESQTEKTVEKIASGGFFLFLPSLNADIPLSNSVKLSLGLGYFLPNVSKLQSVTFNVGLNIGKG